MSSGRTEFPKGENSLFRPGKNFHLNACVGVNGGPYDLHDYANGYFDSGEILIERIRENESRVDILVYPLVFTYRHALELSIKYLAERLPPLFGVSVKIESTHNLTDNWDKVRVFMERFLEVSEDESGKEHIQMVDQVVKDFVQIDPFGQTFRFPETKGGKPHLLNTNIINVEVVGDSMVCVRNVFSAWFYCISEAYSYGCQFTEEY